MTKQYVIRQIVKAGLFVLMGIGIAVLDVESSFAGGTCNSRCQANRRCGDLVKQKGLKDADQRRAEFQKCQRDPQNYK
jgi:hypothetical protein